MKSQCKNKNNHSKRKFKSFKTKSKIFNKIQAKSFPKELIF